MNITTEIPSTSRIAVFIDFDNVEIGVKNTIGGQFDIGLVLEAIKERGEIVTKIAYSDWKRAGDYSRVLAQHAIRMVQRTMTPGGDKNGADITMALDALELAFTHSHINTFVIVGGDSDFISLVEKLKQYGRKVLVVGGRQFTSATMQKNCHEFIAYENLAGTRGGRPAGRGSKQPSSGSTPVAEALPLVRRALTVLSERELTPQLGLLKSTLLQLDSTFSEREYGASSFRDFMEKIAASGAVTLRNVGRSILVESPGDHASTPAVPAAPAISAPVAPARVPRAAAEPVRVVATSDADVDADEVLPPSPMTMQDGIRAVQTAFSEVATPIRWPMYVRQAKQFLRTAISGFDERNYGFASVVDLMRAAGKEGVLRVERDRQGALRLFPGHKLAARPATPADPLVEDAVADVVAEPVEGDMPGEIVSEPPIVDAVVEAAAQDVTGEGVPPARGGRRRKTAAPSAAPKPARSRAKTAKPAPPRAKKTVKSRAVAADTVE
jgi:uncharacterized protein (TIGR00288 family)